MAAHMIPAEMLAAQVTTFGAPYYSLNTVPVPDLHKLAPHELLVKVAVASHCHTDMMVRSGVFGGPLPQTGSHEGSGTVVAAGSAATEAGFGPGARVMVGLVLGPCGSCAECTAPPAQHRAQYCPNTTGSVGVVSDGCFAQYVRADARHSTLLPDAISLLDAAPLACAGRTVWRAVRIAREEMAAGVTSADANPDGSPNNWLAIVGAGGGLGHLGIQFARAQGLRVIAIDARDEGLALARELGAEAVLDARLGDEAVVREIAKVTGERRAGADATLNLADVPGAAGLACAVTRMHGCVVQVAQPDVVSISFREFVFRGMRIRGTVLCAPGESKDMVEFVAKHGLVIKTVAFRGLEKIHEVLDAVEEGKIQGKAAIIIDQEQLDREKALAAKA